MIYAIGHDIVENKRIKKIYDKYGDTFALRLLTIEEFQIYQTKPNKILFLAKRFAAKEAFAKACKTGLRRPVLLRNITILNDEFGRPYFKFANDLQTWLNEQNIINYHLSISDEMHISSAVVILET
jgi:holo-[acyl-carrier protein] synthase